MTDPHSNNVGTEDSTNGEWSDEEMENAEPLPMPEIEDDEGNGDSEDEVRPT